MNPELPAEAVDFAIAAEKAFAALGSVDAARTAEADPSSRAGAVAGALAGLGAQDLDPREDLDTAAAGAELCRAAGRAALPYPVVGVLLSDPGDRIPFALVPEDRCRVDHGDLFESWRVSGCGGGAAVVSGGARRLGSKLGPFVVDLEGGTRREAGDAPTDVVLHLVLTAWRVLGTLERSLELAVEHVRGRIQFGQPLAAFQAVQFQLADAAVATDGLRELCKFTLWRSFVDPEGALADALALRLYAVDSARAVLRTCQQLHGAAGMCDEYDISILYRHIQPDLRLPFGATRTANELAEAVSTVGFESLFPQGGAR